MSAGNAVAADGSAAAGDVATDGSGVGAGAAQADSPDSPESLAVAAARKSGKAVAVSALTDENTEVSAQPDGTLVATIHANPVRARKGGAWAAIDTSLRSAPDGGISPKAVLPGLEFSGGGSQPLVRMSNAGKVLALSWPDPLPKPVLDGDTAEYREILPGVDLRMTATVDGFTQLVVVKTAEAARNPALARLDLGVSGAGLVTRQEADGSLSAVDTAGGGTVFVAPPPVMFDSSAAAKDGPGTASLAAPSPTSKTSPASRAGAAAGTDGAGAGSGGDSVRHATGVGVRVADDRKSMTLTPDQGLLTAPGTVYPVMIDPGWTTPHAGGWTGISRANPSQPYWKFTYNSTYVKDFGTGYCASPTCSANDVKRVLYSLPVHGQAFNGKHILSAEFDVPESFSYSCTKTPVQLYATNRISSGTTWNNANSTSGTSPFWAQYLQTLTDARGRSTCPAANLEFGSSDPKVSTALRTKVQQAADGNWTDLTLGLKAQYESDPAGWKRFTDGATLRVNYNRPPAQALMKDLTMSPGSACQLSSISVNKWPQVTARVYDPDGDKLGVQFAVAWDPGDGFRRRWWSTGAENNVPALSKASGSQFTYPLPTSVPGNTGKVLGWEARAWDGAQWGAWSSAGDVQTDCYFRIDTSIPAGPVVTSTSFPGSSDPTDPLPWTDGVGRYGTFGFDTASTDAVKYEYGLDAAPSSAHSVTTSAGAAASVRLLQQTEGPHYFSVRALDAAGNASAPTTYYFNVAGGQPQHESWSMDDAAGAGSLAGGGGAFEAVLAGNAAGGADGHTGTALSLPGALASDGTPADYATTDGAVVDTSGSFTVSAWVKATDTDTGVSRAAVSQDGSYIAGFSLGLYEGKWTFKTATKDAPGYLWQTAASTQPVVAGTWTHLTGVYDTAAHTQTVYVNGIPSAAVSAPTAPTATGALEFGRILWKGTHTDPWQGSLDDVRVWNRALTATEAANVAADTPVTTGVPAKAVWSLDETGSTVTGRSEASDAAVSGTVTTGTAGAVDGAAHFGADGYARTGRPQVDGTRSFSVSAWVRLPAIAAGDTRPRMAVTQNGVHNNEFSLYYSAYSKKWVFGRYTEDSSTATLVYANQPTCTAGSLVGTDKVPCIGPTTGEWTHLVGVSDATAHRDQLFVNGYLVSTSTYNQTSPWAAPGGLQIGAVSREGVNDEFFGGDIDDVRLFDRVVTASEVKTMIQQRPQLAGRWKFNDAGTTTPPVSPDDLNAHPASLYGPAAISADSAAIGSGALLLDGATAYAATAGAPLRTGESFTLAGWAQTSTPTRDMTVLSLGDGTDSAITVRWHYLRTEHDPDFPGEADLDTIVGEWQAETVSGGTPRAHTVATHSADGVQGSDWTHLAVSYDAMSDQLVLYVNGQTEDQVCDDDTSGTCTPHTSFAGADQPLAATGGLQFGRSLAGGAWVQPFAGQLDDVWAYQGVLTPAQVISLAFPQELDSTTGA